MNYAGGMSHELSDSAERMQERRFLVSNLQVLIELFIPGNHGGRDESNGVHVHIRNDRCTDKRRDDRTHRSVDGLWLSSVLFVRLFLLLGGDRLARSSSDRSSFLHRPFVHS